MNTIRPQDAAYSAEVSADQARKAEPINGAPPYSESGQAPDPGESTREVVHEIMPDDVIRAPGKRPTLPNPDANPASHADHGNDTLQAKPGRPKSKILR